MQQNFRWYKQIFADFIFLCINSYVFWRITHVLYLWYKIYSSSNNRIIFHSKKLCTFFTNLWYKQVWITLFLAILCVCYWYSATPFFSFCFHRHALSFQGKLETAFVSGTWSPPIRWMFQAWLRDWPLSSLYNGELRLGCDWIVNYVQIKGSLQCFFESLTIKPKKLLFQASRRRHSL